MVVCPDRVWRAQGRVAEWLCRGLQILVGRFNSDPGLHTLTRTYGSKHLN